MIEQDVIAHLIDVERLAYELLLDAQREADKRKSLAKEKADQQYRAAYEKIISQMESHLAEGKLSCDKARDTELADFDSHLSAISKSQSSFASYLDSLYAGQ